jgi:hypothetical protein
VSHFFHTHATPNYAIIPRFYCGPVQRYSACGTAIS